MFLIDIKKNLLRTYIRYLIEPINVIPKKDVTLDILDSKITLMVGEEKKIPRFIARILEQNGIVTIASEPRRGEIISQLLRLSQQSAQPRIQKIDSGFYMRLIETLSMLPTEQIADLKKDLEKLIGMRTLKMIHRIYSGKLEGLDIYEQMFLKILLGMIKEFNDVLINESISMIKSFFGTHSSKSQKN